MTLEHLQRLAGVRTQGYGNSLQRTTEGSNISVTAAEKAAIMKRDNIEPGTPEWFKLWFSLPLWFKEGPDR